MTKRQKSSRKSMLNRKSWRYIQHRGPGVAANYGLSTAQISEPGAGIGLMGMAMAALYSFRRTRGVGRGN